MSVFAEHLASVFTLVFSPDGSRLAAITGPKLGDTVTIWDVQSRQLLWTKAFTIPPRSIAFSRDSKELVTGGGGGNGNALVLEIATGKVSAFPELHRGWIQQILFSPDGKTLATCAADDKLILWDLAKRRAKGSPLRHAGNDSAFSPDGRLIASLGYDGRIHVWDVASAKPLALLRGLDPVRHLEFTADGKHIVTVGTDRMIRIWDALRPSDENRLQKHQAWVNGVALSQDGQKLVSVDAEDYALVWGVAQRQPILKLSGDGYVGGGAAFSSDRKLLATSSYTGKIFLWEAETLRSRGVLSNNFGVSNLAFSPDGLVLAAATGFIMAKPNAPTLFLWDPNSRQAIRALPEVAAQNATAVDFSHDGRFLAVAYYDGWVRLWDWKSQRQVWQAHAQVSMIPAVAFSPDDRLLACAGIVDEHVSLCSVIDGRVLKVLEGHTGGVRTLAFAPDGKTLVTGGNDGMIRLWSTTSYETVLVLREHTGAVTSLNFDKSGNLMASSDNEGIVRLWPAPF